MSADGRTGAASAARDGAVPEAAPAAARREITSTELLGGAREIHIRHANEIYTLRQTSKGKLILTK
jgi:hemin uptake protein HemP